MAHMNHFASGPCPYGTQSFQMQLRAPSCAPKCCLSWTTAAGLRKSHVQVLACTLSSRKDSSRSSNSTIACSSTAVSTHLAGTTAAPVGAVHSKSSNSSRRNVAHTRSSHDDSYESPAPMSATTGWQRVEDGLGLDEGTAPDTQDWEEMVSLLSFDGEEHKRVIRQMHGANSRMEDMLASFDGDDFEAVLRAARSELLKQPEAHPVNQQTAVQPAAQETAALASLHASSSDINSSSSLATQAAGGAQGSLYSSVCALRAAAMAVEAARRQGRPAQKKRRVPLEDKHSGDSWMLQVPYAVVTPSTQPGAHVAAAVKAVDSAAAVDSAVLLPAKAAGNSSDPAVCEEGCSRAEEHCQDVVAEDGGRQVLHDTPVLTAAASAHQDGAGMAVLPAATPSNNIVSSKGLVKTSQTQISPASYVLVVCGSVHDTEDTHTAVLVGATAAAASVPAAQPAVSSLQAASRTKQGPRTGSTTATAPVDRSVTAAGASAAGVGGDGAATRAARAAASSRWGCSSTQGLRRALARLHCDPYAN